MSDLLRLFTLGFLMASAANSIGATTTSLDYPSADQTVANGVNNSGVVVGLYLNASGPVHSFLKDGDTWSTIDHPDSVDTFAQGINEAGVVVGDFTDVSAASHGFKKSGSTWTQIDYPNAARTYIGGISPNGKIAGSYYDSNGVAHGFTLDGSTFESFDCPNATHTYFYGITASGLITGSATIDGHDNGIIFNGSNWTVVTHPCPPPQICHWDMKTFASTQTKAAGYYILPSGQAGSTVYAFTTADFEDLTIFSSADHGAQCINDSGAVVGWYVRADGKKSGYLRTP